MFLGTLATNILVNRSTGKHKIPGRGVTRASVGVIIAVKGF